jgi:hypothetical protein
MLVLDGASNVRMSRDDGATALHILAGSGNASQVIWKYEKIIIG